MPGPIKVIDVELSRPLLTFAGLGDYRAVMALVRLYGAPIGYVQLPVRGGECTGAALREAILDTHSYAVVQQLLLNALSTSSRPGGLCIDDLLNTPPANTWDNNASLPLVTVAICTRDRPEELPLCLDALTRLDYPALDLLIIDNAPSSDATEKLVRAYYPQIRCIREQRPGLDWARNRAIAEAHGEIVAFTDDDAVVDPAWVKALVRIFITSPEVMAVTGLVVPYELETEAQHVFERIGGFGRGFKRKWVRLDPEDSQRWKIFGTGQFGTGANMAYRRSVFDQIGYFDPALDVGTVTNGGGDLEMFFRVLKEGHTLVYEPSAIVRHRHRRDYAHLQTQITNNGIGLYSYFIRSALAYPDEYSRFVYLGLWWLWKGNIRPLLVSLVHPDRIPRKLRLAQLWGSLIGLVRYQRARRIAEQILINYGPLSEATAPTQGVTRKVTGKHKNAIAVRMVNLGRPLCGLNDVNDYARVRVFVLWDNHLLGNMDIANHYQLISPTHLCEAIVDHVGLRLLDSDRRLSMSSLWANAIAFLTQRYMLAKTAVTAMPKRLPASIPVSVVVATLDRPDDLRNCLRCLIAQESPRPVEIVVVDNNPTSGLTPPVVAEFPDVVLVNEPRKGLAYARNAGFTACKGDIAIATDDDVIMPAGWLETLVAPFVRPEVMIVTGNTLPLKMETTAQELFERYGGLGRGFEPLEVNGDWFESFRHHPVPTWQLGATANAAFRVTIFNHPQIGLMDEALGPGTPSGVGEDTYLFYKVLKANYTLVYEPAAYVWHKHRETMSALRRQIYNYSKGHVSYHLTTLFRDHDTRSLWQLMLHLPRFHLRRIVKYFLRRNPYPLSLIMLEIAGNLVGPWTLWRSHRRVRRLGHSRPYVPFNKHVSGGAEEIRISGC